MCLYTFHLALKQVKQTGGWCDSDFCISWMGCCIAKPGPGAQSFQKKNYLNCPTTTVVPKTVFQNQTRMRQKAYRDWETKRFFLVEQRDCKRSWESTKDGSAEGRWSSFKVRHQIFPVTIYSVFRRKKQNETTKPNETVWLAMLKIPSIGASSKWCREASTCDAVISFLSKIKRPGIRGSLGLLMNG